MEINDRLVLNKSSSVIERFGEELLLFDSSTGKLFEVNETGKMIWTLLDGKNTVQDIREKFNDEFEDNQALDEDLSFFLARLLQLQLVEMLK